MDIKWQRWKYQNWKSPPVFDAVVLPRSFVDSNIRYMESIEGTFVVILSRNTNIEIWNIKSGSVVYNISLDDSLKYVDYCHLYQHESENETSNIHNWTMIIANREGLVVKKICDSQISDLTLHDTGIRSINKCFCKSIFEIKSLILVNSDITVISCMDFSTLFKISDPFEKEIHCVIVAYDNIIAAADQNLLFFQTTMSECSEIKWNLIKKWGSHKNQIVTLIEIDENSLASVSCEAVKIWKRPDFNITRMFNTSEETGNINVKSMLCSIYNSRYLTIAFDNSFAIFDCINGSTMAKVLH